MHFTIKFIQPIILLIILITNVVYCDTNSKKKELKDQNIPPESHLKPDDAILSNPNVATNSSKHVENTTKIYQESNSNDKTTKPTFLDLDKNDIPPIYETGFILCIVVGVIAIILIFYKAYNMRRSRAERRYGVLGDRGAQELTPLPNAVEDDDSDIEDHTLFDRNRIT